MKSLGLVDEIVQKEMEEEVRRCIDALVSSVGSFDSFVEAEREVVRRVFALGRVVLALVFEALCRQRALAFIERRRVEMWRFRRGESYVAKLTTTLGPVRFPWNAVRVVRKNGTGSKTLNPAKKELLPSYSSCRSSPLVLEWECELAASFPYRESERAMKLFTHGGVTLEDTTIARHAVAIGNSLDRKWLYRDADEIARIVRSKATRCTKTGRPLVYISSDAHALRRYVDDTWRADWKMINGLRVWCIDKDKGSLIHLGGEYTWGDCTEVGRILQATFSDGYLPANGDFGGSRRALYVWLSDGMPWFDDHLLPLFEPDSLLVVLDAYHVVERIKGFATAMHRKSKQRAKALFDNCVTWVFGQRDSDDNPSRKKRRGATKPAPQKPEPRYRTVDDDETDYAALFLHAIDAIPCLRKARVKAKETLYNYLKANAYRIDYAEYDRRGISIGSGPMESLHRTASQKRLKLPGARWMTETSQALLNLRLMSIVGKNDTFWNRKNLPFALRDAFNEAAP